MKKNVEQIISPPRPHWVGDGFKVHGFIPGMPQLNFERMDPFLVMDYNAKTEFSPSEKQRGVGVHPHKGFETVTIAYKGSVAHTDSSGGGGTIHEGDVQWMTAGKGILHKEFHAPEFSKKGGIFQMIQLWVNLSSENKKQAPKYQSIQKEDIKIHALEDGKGKVEVIAGKYKDTTGPADTFSPVHLMNARLKKGGKAKFSFPSNYTTAMVVLEGEIKINNEQEAPQDNFVLMENKGEDFEIEAIEDALVLVLSGEPLKEPIAAHGPFVMNTREELITAFNEFNSGKFGYLE